MLTSQRKSLILERLLRDGDVVAKTLSQEWAVSEDTIRRDLRELAQAGKLQRVHGGALPASPAAAPLEDRLHMASAEKLALGKAGAAMVQPGQVVFLDGGSTAMQLAAQLDPHLRATFVTHSPSVAIALAAKPHLDIIVLGGTLYRHSMVHVGASVIESAQRMRADIFFMGVTGVHPDVGLSTANHEEAAVKRALHACAAETVVLASPEKLGTASPFVVAPLPALSTLLVAAGTPTKMLNALRATGVRVVMCPPV